MKDGREKRGSGSAAFAVVVILLMLPLLYAASIGPAFWLLIHGLLPVNSELFNGFYEPLRFVCANCHLESLLDWWIHQWIGYPA